MEFTFTPARREIIYRSMASLGISPVSIVLVDDGQPADTIKLINELTRNSSDRVFHIVLFRFLDNIKDDLKEGMLKHKKEVAKLIDCKIVELGQPPEEKNTKKG